MYLLFSGPTLLYRLEVKSTGYTLLVTDLVQLYVEDLIGENKILERCQKLNPGTCSC